jgi:ParB/RepB/Spo0J family partition protein
MSRSIALDTIVIDRENRQRRDFSEKEIDELASSFMQHGQIQPIVVRDGNVLVAGERRTLAAKQLGWSHIECVDRADLDEVQAYAIELEENIKRADLLWRDKCRAIWQYHQYQKNQNPEHRLEDTAQQLSMSVSIVSDYILVHDEAIAGNELVNSADKFSVAVNITRRQRERKLAAAEEDIRSFILPEENIAPDPMDELTEGEGAATSEQETTYMHEEPADAKQIPLRNVDFLEWVETYSGPRFNFIHCDFPYGVNADKHHQGAAKYFRGYSDSPDVYWQLVAALGDNIERLVADSAHLVFWFSMDFYHETKMALEQMGWRVNPFPLIWYKSDNTGILPDPSRGPRRIYETAFLASRGDRKIIRAVGNVASAPVTKRVHMSEKSLPMLHHFFRMIVDETTVMLDPTCGSGNAVKVAQQAGAKSVLGLERDPEFYDNARLAWVQDEEAPFDLKDSDIEL